MASWFDQGRPLPHSQIAIDISPESDPRDRYFPIRIVDFQDDSVVPHPDPIAPRGYEPFHSRRTRVVAQAAKSSAAPSPPEMRSTSTT
jgi:hypothetical protein